MNGKLFMFNVSENGNLISVNKLKEITGKSRSTIWRWVRAGIMPSPIKIGPNSIVWTNKQIELWLESRMDYEKVMRRN